MSDVYLDQAARDLIEALTVTVGGRDVLRPLLTGPVDELRAAMRRGADHDAKAGSTLAGLAATDDRELTTVAATAAVKLAGSGGRA